MCDIDAQYAISLGEFNGGALMVEAEPRTVYEVDTHDAMAKVDGRFPHWVAPYTGSERFSIIWFRTKGDVTPQTTAFISGEDEVKTR